MARNISEVQTTAAPPGYPTLTAIDEARGNDAVPYVADPNASSLERRARDLTDEYWSETTWLTGLVSPAQLAAVCARLDAEREDLRGSIRVFVAPEAPAKVPPAAE